MLFANVDTIEQEGGGTAADSADDVAVDDLRPDGERVASGWQQDGAGSELGQAEEAAAVEREVCKLFVGNHCA